MTLSIWGVECGEDITFGSYLRGRSQKEVAKKKILATPWAYSRCADLSRCALYREFTVIKTQSQKDEVKNAFEISI